MSPAVLSAGSPRRGAAFQFPAHEADSVPARFRQGSSDFTFVIRSVHLTLLQISRAAPQAAPPSQCLLPGSTSFSALLSASPRSSAHKCRAWCNQVQAIRVRTRGEHFPLVIPHATFSSISRHFQLGSRWRTLLGACKNPAATIRPDIPQMSPASHKPPAAARAGQQESKGDASSLPQR